LRVAFLSIETGTSSLAKGEKERGFSYETLEIEGTDESEEMAAVLCGAKKG